MKLLKLFLNDLKREALKENIWDSNVLVNINQWISHIIFENTHDIERKVADEMIDFMKEIHLELPYKMISFPTFFTFLNDSSERSFTSLTNCLEDFLIRLLIKTFKTVETDCEWTDIMIEQMFNEDLKSLDLKTWMRAHLMIQRSEFDETKFQEDITAAENFYDKKRVVSLTNGFAIIQLD